MLRLLPSCGADLASPAPRYRPTVPIPSNTLSRRPIASHIVREAAASNGRKGVGSETVGLGTSLSRHGKLHHAFVAVGLVSGRMHRFRTRREPAQATFPELPALPPQSAFRRQQLISACIEATRSHPTLASFEKSGTEGYSWFIIQASLHRDNGRGARMRDQVVACSVSGQSAQSRLRTLLGAALAAESPPVRLTMSA